jgi:hypothetical protein
MVEFTSYAKFALPRFQIIGALILTLFKQKTWFNHMHNSLKIIHNEEKEKKLGVKPVVMGIHKYLVELGLNIPLHFWDGGIYRTRQIYRFQFLNNTAHQKEKKQLV